MTRCPVPSAQLRVEKPPGWRELGTQSRGVLAEEHAVDELASVVDPGLLEDRLEVVLDGIGGDVQRGGDVLGVDASQHELGDVTFAGCDV